MSFFREIGVHSLYVNFVSVATCNFGCFRSSVLGWDFGSVRQFLIVCHFLS